MRQNAEEVSGPPMYAPIAGSLTTEWGALTDPTSPSGSLILANVRHARAQRDLCIHLAQFLSCSKMLLACPKTPPSANQACMHCVGENEACDEDDSSLGEYLKLSEDSACTVNDVSLSLHSLAELIPSAYSMGRLDLVWCCSSKRKAQAAEFSGW